MERICQSHWFRDSHQLQAFLRYVVEETLAGREEGLKEFSIGCSVFHRSSQYDPRLDSIVRVQASLLRKKLQSYYSNEGSQDPLVIDLPRGGYVPSFHRAVPVAADKAEPSPPPRRLFRLLAAGFAAGVLFTAVVLLALGGVASRDALTETRLDGLPDYPAAGDCPSLWAPFLSTDSGVLLSYGQPRFYRGGGLYIRDVRINTGSETESAAVLGKLSKALGVHLVPDDRTYTGMGELNGILLMSNFLFHHRVPVRVEGIRSISPEELGEANLILISSLRFQTLLSQMGLPRDFVFDSAGEAGIRNLDPRPGESPTYESQTGADVTTSYALISLWPAADPRHRILHLGGMHSWATLAAVQYVTARESARELKELLERSGSPDHYQVLLKVEGVSGQPRSVRYVTHHELATIP